MQPQTFFTQHSPMTDPGIYRARYEPLPDNPAAIVRVVQGLIRHYNTPGVTTPPDRMPEIDTRYVAAMLRRMLELDPRPLTEPRVVEHRFIGCCRDYTVLAVSMLRHQGIPARARFGAAAYFDVGHFHDHAILEYWNGDRWVGVDVQLDEAEIRRHHITINPDDVASTEFITGGRGWLMCRRQEVAPDRFGLGAGSPLRGMHFTLGELLLDLAALNRMELLCWDSWGYGTQFDRLNADDYALLDRAAAATLDENQFAQWQPFFQQEGLHLPGTILSFSPALHPSAMPARVTLA